MATVRCPTCDRSIEVDDAYRDWTVRCPHCGAEFVPREAIRAARERDRPRYDEYDYEPAGAASPARDEALRLVAAPALWLELCGWLSALGSVGVALLCAVLAVEFANNPPPNANDDVIVFVILGCGVGAFGVPYSVALALGARKMRTLSSRSWAMTAAILGIGAFAMFGCWGIFHTGFGAWALVTLEKPVVREAFGLPVRPSRD